MGSVAATVLLVCSGLVVSCALDHHLTSGADDCSTLKQLMSWREKEAAYIRAHERKELMPYALQALTLEFNAHKAKMFAEESKHLASHMHEEANVVAKQEMRSRLEAEGSLQALVAYDARYEAWVKNRLPHAGEVKVANASKVHTTSAEALAATERQTKATWLVLGAASCLVAFFGLAARSIVAARIRHTGEGSEVLLDADGCDACHA